MKWWREAPAGDTDDVRARHAENRIAWNEGARGYSEDNDNRVRWLRAGESSLHSVERANLARVGPLAQWCRRAIHLQCASGYDTLSLYLEGAQEVIGVDISDVHIDNARQTSDQLGFPASWYCCDILDAPTELDASADLLYTGRGALCWLHDINAWAAVCARLLRAGGVLSLFDDHPASWLFDPESEELQASKLDYFRHAEAVRGWPDEYLGDLGKDDSQHTVKHARLWPIGDVFQALTGAGFVVEYLGEHNDEYWASFPKLSAVDKATLPLTFSILARRR